MALITCPYCGKAISDQAETCVHCGKRTRQKIQIITCPECNSCIDASVHSCPACGYPIKPKKQTMRKGKKLIYGAVALVVLVLVSIAAVLIINTAKTAAQEREKLERYEEIVQRINSSSKGEKKLWDSSKTDPELKEYVLVNMNDNAIRNLYKSDNRWYPHEIFIPIEDIFSIGAEKVSAEKIQTLLYEYMYYMDKDRSQIDIAVTRVGNMYENGEYEDLEQYIRDIRTGKIYTGDPRKEIEEFMLGRAEIKIKSVLKDPDSYKRTSYSCNIDLDESTGAFEATIKVKYTATNSFGGRVSDSYSVSCDGTIVDGKITLGD